jgi:hypothetical protein
VAQPTTLPHVPNNNNNNNNKNNDGGGGDVDGS